MKKLCKNCLYWCQRTPIHYLPYGNCSCEKFIYAGTSSYSTDSLFYWDAEGCAASFVTGPEFGCVHWRRKEKEAKV